MKYSESPFVLHAPAHMRADRRTRRSGRRCARQPDPQRGGAVDAGAVGERRQGRVRLRRDGGPGRGHRGAGLVRSAEQAADAVVQASQCDDGHNGDESCGQQRSGGWDATAAGRCRGVSAGSAEATEKPGGATPFQRGLISMVAHLPQGNARRPQLPIFLADWWKAESSHAALKEKFSCAVAERFWDCRRLVR